MTRKERKESRMIAVSVARQAMNDKMYSYMHDVVSIRLKQDRSEVPFPVVDIDELMDTTKIATMAKYKPQTKHIAVEAIASFEKEDEGHIRLKYAELFDKIAPKATHVRLSDQATMVAT